MVSALVALVVSLLALLVGLVVSLLALVVSLVVLVVSLPPFFALFRILSLQLIHVFFSAFACCLNTVWVFCNFLLCFVHVYFRVQGKNVERKMDPIFEHSVFD